MDQIWGPNSTTPFPPLFGILVPQLLSLCGIEPTQLYPGAAVLKLTILEYNLFSKIDLLLKIQAYFKM